MGHPKDEQIPQDIDAVGPFEPQGHPDLQGLMCKLIDNIQHPILLSVIGAVFEKVIGPHVIGIFRTQAHTCAVVEPKTASLGFFLPGL